MSYYIDFANQRTTDGCTFVDVLVYMPDYQQRDMTVSGGDTAIIVGSDLLGWDITFGPRITADLIDGLEIPGITLGINRFDSTIHGSGLVYARDFPTLETAKAFVRHLYQRFYEALYLGLDTYTVEPSHATDTAAEAAPDTTPAPRQAVVLTVSPRSVPAPLTRDGAAHRVALCSTPERVTFYPPGMDAPPATLIHTHPRNTQ